MKVALNGGTPMTLASEYRPRGIVVDAENVYWNSVMASGNQGYVRKVPLNGGTVTTLASVPGVVIGLQVNATSVFYTYDTLASASGTGVDSYDLMSVPVQGGTPTTLLTDEGTVLDLAIDGASIYWSHTTPTDGNGEALIADTIEKVPLSGGTPTVLASGLSNPDCFVVRDGILYWVDFAINAVMSMPTAGGAPTTLVPSSEVAHYWGIAVDTRNVYFADATEGTVQKVCRRGGKPKTLASGQDYPHSLAVDATSIYWLNGQYSNEGQVMKLRLP
jgi:hypothetical protein